VTSGEILSIANEVSAHGIPGGSGKGGYIYIPSCSNIQPTNFAASR